MRDLNEMIFNSVVIDRGGGGISMKGCKISMDIEDNHLSIEING